MLKLLFGKNLLYSPFILEKFESNFACAKKIQKNSFPVWTIFFTINIYNCWFSFVFLNEL